MVDGAQDDFVREECEPGPTLNQAFVRFLLILAFVCAASSSSFVEHVMSEGDEVVRVPEGEYSLAILLLTVALVATELSRNGEEVFEDLCDSFSDLGGEVVEDEVRIYLLNRLYSIDVVSILTKKRLGSRFRIKMN